MALTQISTAGVKDDAVTSGKIPANAVGTSEIADDAVTTAKIAKPLDFADNEKARFGTGNDLELYHDGSNSYLINGTGDLTLQNGSGNTNQIRIRGQNGEESIVANGNGSVDLYYDNSKKLETITWGVDIQGNTRTSGDFVVIDNGKFRAGYASDLQIYHDGTDSIIKNSTGKFEIHADQFRIRNEADSKILFSADNNANVYLYYNNNEKLRTENTGITVTGTVAATSFTGDGSSLSGINTDLVSDTSPQLGGTLDLNGNKIDGADSNGSSTNIVLLGTGDDLKMYHDGNNSYLSHENGSGHLYLQGDAIRLRTRSATNNDDYIVCSQGGPVSLYYNDSLKFKTLSDGCQTVGRLGVNTSAPAKNLHVADSGVTTVRIETTDSRGQAWDILSTNGAQNNTGTLSFRDESGSAYLEFGANEGSPKLQMNLGGANALFLVDNDGHVTQPKQPYLMVGRSGNQSVGNNSGDVIQFNSEHFDEGSNFNTSNHRFTAPVDGVYQVNVQVQYTGNINLVHAGLYKNGGNPGTSATFDPWCNWGDNIRGAVFVHAIKLSSGDYLEAVTYQSSGGTRTLEQNRTKMTIYLLG